MALGILYNKIPICRIFYLLKGDYRFWLQVSGFRALASAELAYWWSVGSKEGMESCIIP